MAGGGAAHRDSGSQNGGRLRVREKGARRKSGGFGDLYVRLVARLPSQGSEALDELARQMQGLYGDENVRAELERSNP